MFNWFKRKETPKLPFGTDVHCHLVPGVDDGSQTVEKSVMLLRHMQRWGVTRIIPTPHVTEDTFENTPAIIDPAYRALTAGADEAGVDIELLSPSGEYRIDSFFLNCLDKGLVRPLRGSYLLVENGFSIEPWNIESLIFDLAVKGFKPILAHPERYRYYHSEPERYRRLHDSGLLMQCNLLSFTGYYGKDIRNMAHWMLDNDLIDFLGTDLHGMTHVQAIERYMSTSAFRHLSKILEPRLLNDKIG